MNILLTHTYFLEEDAHEKEVMKPYPPLGLLYLSAYLKQHGFEVDVFDTTFSSYDNLETRLEEHPPDVLGIHCNLLTKFNVLQLIRFCQSHNITSILGGPDASTQVHEFLQYGADILISGEGEEPLLNVLNALQSKSKHQLHGIANVSFKDERGVVIQNDRQASRRRLDDYPFPDRDAINMEQYLSTWQQYHGMRPVSIITARGCAFTCKWCSHSVYGWTHRRRRPEAVVEEIKYLIDRYQPSHLWYADDVFTVNRRWLRSFDALLKRKDIYLPFEGIARADRMDEEIVSLLKSMGCYRIWFGAESGSQRILDAMSRGVRTEEIIRATELCKQYGIKSGVFVMFGYPGETLADIYETIRFISELQPDHFLTTVAYPLRGTELYDELKDRVLEHSDWQSHLQRELEIEGRYTPALYHYAVRKLASDYQRLYLNGHPKESLKRFYHRLRSFYCDFRMKRLSRIQTG